MHHIILCYITLLLYYDKIWVVYPKNFVNRNFVRPIWEGGVGGGRGTCPSSTTLPAPEDDKEIFKFKYQARAKLVALRAGSPWW